VTAKLSILFYFIDRFDHLIITSTDHGRHRPGTQLEGYPILKERLGTVVYNAQIPLQRALDMASGRSRWARRSYSTSYPSASTLNRTVNPRAGSLATYPIYRGPQSVESGHTFTGRERARTLQTFYHNVQRCEGTA
jgi:hypothetical protein